MAINECLMKKEVISKNLSTELITTPDLPTELINVPLDSSSNDWQNQAMTPMECLRSVYANDSEHLQIGCRAMVHYRPFGQMNQIYRVALRFAAICYMSCATYLYNVKVNFNVYKATGGVFPQKITICNASYVIKPSGGTDIKYHDINAMSWDWETESIICELKFYKVSSSDILLGTQTYNIHRTEINPSVNSQYNLNFF